ncbi:MAG: twin-arginine translocation signal domain-containing protein, partial [Lysobacterales bacterium]
MNERDETHSRQPRTRRRFLQGIAAGGVLAVFGGGARR